MLKEKNPLLKLKLRKEKSIITKVLNKIYESLFGLFELILDEPIENIYFEIIILFICYIQIIMFIFNETVSKYYLKLAYYNLIKIYSFYHFGIKIQLL